MPAEFAGWAHRGLTNPAIAGLFNIVGLAVTLAILAIGSWLAAGIVVGAMISVFGALFIYGKIFRDRVGGLFEVVHDIHEWRILDHSGERATMTRTRNARVLQDGVFAIRDFAWGSRGSHTNPRCSGGWPIVVHKYESHDRIVALLALEDVRNRDDSLEYSICWDVKGVFIDLENWAETEILNETVRLTMRVIFPPTRVPLAAYLTCSDAPDKRKDLAIRPRDDETFEVVHNEWYPKRHRIYRLTWLWPVPRQAHQAQVAVGEGGEFSSPGP
jgi:hypothetical protein